MQLTPPAAALLAEIPGWLSTGVSIVKVLIGFSIIIFFHELGHYLACRWVNVRVHRFAVGFGKRLCGYRKGEGFTFGSRPNYTVAELNERGYGETDYSLMALPIGGYVKMEDHDFDEATEKIVPSKDPRAFSNRPPGKRLIVLSAGVVFNVLLAALLFVLVYLIGRNVQAPVVGSVAPTGPSHGKLLPGDRIVSVDGEKPNSYLDVVMAEILADGPMSLEVVRDGKLLPPIVIQPELNPRHKFNDIGIFPMFTTRAIDDGTPIPGRPNLLRGDLVTHVDGKPVRSADEVAYAFLSSRGKPIEMTVQRPADPAPGQTPQTLKVYQRAFLNLDPADNVPDGYDKAHLLGFIRRQCVGALTPGDPAEKAGFAPGDAIESWAGLPNPTYTEIVAAIQRDAEKAIPATVERGSARIDLSVKPKRGFKLFGKPKDAIVGIRFGVQGLDDKPKVARIVPATPAFEAFGDVRGILLRKIDGQPVATWTDATEALMAAAGRKVPIEHETGGQIATVEMQVPGSFVNELVRPDGTTGLPPAAFVLAIDGQSKAQVENSAGKEVEVGLLNSPNNIARVLAQKVGRTVTISYRDTVDGPDLQGSFAVRRDNLDPWQLRAKYLPESLPFEQLMEPVSAHGNPLVALKMGYLEVKRIIVQTWQSMSALAQRKVGTDSVAGPIGIVKIGVMQAELGITDLMFFLAILSINLAAINLLPIPILDGGHIIFVLIEKVKGRPLSFNVRFYTGLIGLAAIILIGIFVTIQDIGSFF